MCRLGKHILIANLNKIYRLQLTDGRQLVLRVYSIFFSVHIEYIFPDLVEWLHLLKITFKIQKRPAFSRIRRRDRKFEFFITFPNDIDILIVNSKIEKH